MTDETFDAFQALCDLHDSWNGQLEASRVVAAGLLADSRARERVNAVADRQRRARLIEASTTASVLMGVCQDLEEVLGDIEEARIRRYPQAHASHPQPASLSDDGSPLPF